MSFLQLMRTHGSAGAEEPALTDPSLAWEEAVERTSVHGDLRVKDLLGSSVARTVAFESADGEALQATLTIGAEQRGDGACTLRVEFENGSALAGGPAAKREEALPQVVCVGACVVGNRGRRVYLFARSRGTLPRVGCGVLQRGRLSGAGGRGAGAQDDALLADHPV